MDVCPVGWTTNGNTEKICQPCDPSCAACEDNGEVGDIARCTQCAASHPMWYSPESRCFESCGLGYYTAYKDVDKAGKVVGGSCGKCQTPCAECQGDSRNCTWCQWDPKKAGGQTPALFVSKQSYTGDVVKNGKTIKTRIDTWRGSCYKTCPNGYFLNTTEHKKAIDPLTGEVVELTSKDLRYKDIKCRECKSPCGTCVDRADRCLSCDGANNQTYEFGHRCYEECPNKTAPDMGSLKCKPCEANCNKCGTESKSCFECVRPFLLEAGECVTTCKLPGYRPNRAGTQCINKSEFPFIGPVFSGASAVAIVAITMVRCVKKET